MMDKKQQVILMELMNYESLTGNQLASIILMSSRSVRTLIKDLNLLLINHGALIESNTSYGYRLVLKDPDTFLLFIQENSQNINEDNDQTRMNYIFKRLITNREYIKIDDLCDALYLSRTQIKSLLKELRLYFESYNLEITSKPHYGIYLNGSERNIRKAMSHFDDWNKNEIRSKDYEYHLDKIKKIIISCLANADYEITEDALRNVANHLYIAYQRVNENNIVTLNNELFNQLKDEREYELATHMMTLMSRMLGMPYNEQECAYLTMHLCGKNAKQFSSLYIDDKIYKLVEEMLAYIENSSSISFAHDLNLQLALALHIVPLLKRIQYKTYMKNALTEDIKTSLIFAYELALKASEAINTYYHCILPEDEVAYFALHINLSLEQKKTESLKKNILIVCSSGAGSAKLLEYSFKEYFSSYINKLDVCSYLNLADVDMNKYSCIFTTVPLQIEVSIPVFAINHLINKNEIEKIDKKIKQLSYQNSIQYFPKELFFHVDEFATKEVAISQIVSRCALVYSLPSDFEEQILEREKMASTEFNELVAFPHTIKPSIDTTFISITILKKPLLWNQNRIRIIMLCSIENNLIKELDGLYRTISSLISDQKIQWELLKQPSYDTLEKIIERLEK